MNNKFLLPNEIQITLMIFKTTEATQSVLKIFEVFFFHEFIGKSGFFLKVNNIYSANESFIAEDRTITIVYLQKKPSLTCQLKMSRLNMKFDLKAI